MTYSQRRLLGQHFLKNKEKLRKIAAFLEIEKNDTIVEIGPGHGELTNELRKVDNDLRIVAIEKDAKLARLLKEKFSTQKNIEIIEGDVLKILPELPKTYNLKPITYKLIGNIPYYITGKLLRTVGDLITNYKLPITAVVLTIQKEVAERLCAHPPKMNPPHRKCPMCGMNLLAASVQIWAEPEIVDYIPKKDFQPPPKVDSAIIKLRIRNYESGIIENYYKLIKTLFKQPRKTILNNLINIKRFDIEKIDADVARSNLSKLLKKIGINPNDRPQNLGLEEIKKITRNFLV